MGLVLPQKVSVGISNINIGWYSSKSYSIPKHTNSHGKEVFSMGSKIAVDVKDLQSASHTKAKCECDNCKSQFYTTYRLFNLNFRKSHRTYCKGCALKEIQKNNGHANTGIYKWASKEYALSQLNLFILKNKTLKGWTVNNTEGNRINTSLRNNGYNIPELCMELGYDFQKLQKNIIQINIWMIFKT